MIDLSLAFSLALATTQSPNFVVIVADDLGYGDVGCYGQTKIQTPQLDRMAEEGIRFTSFYAGSTVCAPSRCCLLTGLHTGHARIRGNGTIPLQPEDVTIAEALEPWTSAVIGKWGLGEAGSTGVPNAQGFEFFYGYLNQIRAHNYYPDFLWRNDAREPLRNVVQQKGKSEFGSIATQRLDYSHDLFTNEALQFLTQHQDEPFFLLLSYTIPHANNEGGDEGMEIPHDAPYSDEDWPQAQRNHAAMISLLDRDVGKVRDHLATLGIDDRTYVFFTSDNGPHDEGGADHQFFDSNGPLRGKKRDLYEGGIRVPFLATGPGIEAGREHGGAWAGWDLLPTLTALAGQPTPAGIDGHSFAGVLDDSDPSVPDRPLYWAFYGRKGSAVAARSGPWKAVRVPHDGPLELYDLEKDLEESHDLASANPQEAKRLEQILADSHVDSPDWEFFEPEPSPKWWIGITLMTISLAVGFGRMHRRRKLQEEKEGSSSQ